MYTTKFIFHWKNLSTISWIFCLPSCTGEPDCPGIAYEALRDLMVALQREGIKDQLSSLIAHVVECDSEEDITTYGVSTSCMDSQ